MSRGEFHDQPDPPAVDHDLALVFEIHRDLAADIGLHLSQPPIWPIGVAHQHPRL